MGVTLQGGYMVLDVIVVFARILLVLMRLMTMLASLIEGQSGAIASLLCLGGWSASKV